MSEAAKKLRKLKDQLDILEAKEHEILDRIDEVIEELNKSDD